MNDAELENLLESADAAVPIARLAEGLPTRVRRRARQGARAKLVTIAVLLAPLLSLPAYLTERRTPQIAEREPIRVTTTDLKAQLAALDDDANFHLRIAQDISCLESAREAAPSVIPSLPAAIALRADQFSTAAVLVQSAGDTESDREGRPETIATYRNVIRLFPDAPAAATARQRLRELDNG